MSVRRVSIEGLTLAATLAPVISILIHSQERVAPLRTAR